jgi:hypothetical protein
VATQKAAHNFHNFSYQLIAINIYIKAVSPPTQTRDERVGEATTFFPLFRSITHFAQLFMRMYESFRAFHCERTFIDVVCYVQRAALFADARASKTERKNRFSALRP